MTLSQLRILLAVFEAGSFTKAGAVLGITQSGVSHAIATLEAELGITLLERERDRITLSETGERVLVHVREILSRTEQIRESASDVTSLRVGKLRIGSFPSASTRLLPGIMGAFRRRYPGIDLVLFEGTDQEVVNWLHSGAVDVGVVTLPTQGLEAVPIAQDEMLVVLPASHRLAGDSALSVQRIAGEPFIMSKGGCEPLITSIFRAAGLVHRSQFEVRDMGTIMAMVQEGLGVTIVPEMVLPSSLEAICVLHLDPPVQRQLGLAVCSMDASSPPVKAFTRQAQIWADAHGYKRP